MAWQKAVAQDVSITFYSGGVPTAPTGALTATISKDGGGFAGVGGSVVQVGATPAAVISLDAADMNCDTGVVCVVDGGGAVDDRYMEFATEANYTAARATLITTIGTCLSGITSLANWLRGLYRKNAMNATAKTEVNLGGGAYNETTDSQEALRDTAPMGSAMVGTDGAAIAGDAMNLVNDAVGDASVESYAKFKATGFAVAGDKMDIVDVPSSMGLTAIAMAVWNTLTSVLTTVGSIGKKLAEATWGVISVGVTPYLLSADQDELEVRWGNKVTILFTLYASDDSEYDFTNTTAIYFTVKRGDHLTDTDDTHAVIGDGVPKSMDFDAGTPGAATLILDAADTKRCVMDDPYRFEITIINSTGDSPVSAMVGIFKSTTTVTRTAT